MSLIHVPHWATLEFQDIDWERTDGKAAAAAMNSVSCDNGQLVHNNPAITLIRRIDVFQRNSDLIFKSRTLVQTICTHDIFVIYA